MNPGRTPAGPRKAQAACSELTQPFCLPLLLTRPPRRGYGSHVDHLPGAGSPWTWLEAQHTHCPAGGRDKPCPQGQTGTCSA